jgi:heme oxygenase
VHGSVLERRPPAELLAGVEAATGERWGADGLAAGGVVPDGAALWRSFVAHLSDSVAHRAEETTAP